MSTQNNNSPEIKLADGSIRISGFRRTGKNGDFISFVPQRSYADGETVKYADNFSGDDLLKLARLAQMAYDQHKEFQAAEYAKRDQTAA